jgi:hypothetical protein
MTVPLKLEKEKLTWWKEGKPRRPTLSDKLADWNALALIGGQAFMKGRRVLDIGPEWGLDAIMFGDDGPAAYVCLECATDVVVHLDDMKRATDSKYIIMPGDARSMAQFKDGTFNLVLDFGSIDNCNGNLNAYIECCRVLSRHGIMITSYANAAVLGNGVSDDGSEARVQPQTLANFFTAEEMWVRGRFREDQARAVMIVQKGGEPQAPCQWNATNVCTCA